MKGNEFIIRDYKDLLEKIEQEFHLYQLDTDQRTRNYLLNIILSMNHLLDWVINDPSVPLGIKTSCVRLFNPYDQKAVQEIRRSTDKRKKQMRDAYNSVDGFIHINHRQLLVKIFANHEKHFTSPDEIMAFATVAGEPFFEWNMETEEERKKTERELKKAYGKKLPPHAQKWLDTPRSVLSGDFTGILSLLINEWKRVLGRV